MDKKILVDLYSIILGCYMFIIGINTSLLMGDSISRAFIDILFSIMLAVFIIGKNRYDTKKLILFVVVVISFAISGYFTHRIYIMTYALLIVAATRCNSCNSAIKAALIGSAASGAIVLVLSQIGFIPDIVMIRGSANANWFFSKNAHCFGYNYYHFIPYKLFFIMLGVMKIKKKKMSWLEILIWIILNFVVFYFSTIRLTFYLGFFSLALYIVLVKFDWLTINKKAIKSIMTLSFPVTIVVTSLFYYFYNPDSELYALLNLFSSSRVRLGHEAFERYPIKLFGQLIKTSHATNRTKYFYLDSGYIYAILGYGIVFSIVVVIMYSCLCRFACERNDKVLLIWLISVLLFTISNNIWVELSMNPILVIFPIMWNQRIKEIPTKHRLKGIYYLEH